MPADANADLCPLIEPTNDREKLFFLQLTPLVYDFDTRIDAIYPGSLQLQLPALPDISKIGIGQLRQAVTQNLKKNKIDSAQRFRAFAKKALATPGLAWLSKGKAYDTAQWALGIEYEQTWKSTGFKRGRLIKTVPVGLYPSSTEISIRTWLHKNFKSALALSTESLTSDEMSNDEKWSLSTRKEIARQNNSTFSPSATLNSISIPVQQGVSVGASGNLGISGSIDDKLGQNLTSGREFVQSATEKAVQSLKITRNQSVEESVESGQETTTKETLPNPNHCNTLNYLYYEVLEQIAIETKPSAIDLYLLVPLVPVQNVTDRWLLEYECVLRPLIACDKLLAGFDAAKTNLVLQRVALARKLLDKQSQKPKDTSSKEEAQKEKDLAKSIGTTIDAVLTSYSKLVGSSSDSGAGDWLYWTFVDTFSPELRDALAVFKEHYDRGSSDQKKDLDFLTDVVGQLFQSIGKVDDVFAKVDTAVAIAEGASAAAIALLPFGVVIAPIVAAIMAGLELMGIDALPDDEGLRRNLITLSQRYEADLAPREQALVPAPPASAAAPTSPAAPGSSAPAPQPSTTDLLRAVLASEGALRERAEAQVEAQRLRDHIRDNLLYYQQAIWSRWSSEMVRDAVETCHVPSDIVELRFSAFRGNTGACRVVNLDLLHKNGIDLDKLRKSALQKAAAEDQRFQQTILVPTPGLVVESSLGQCTGADTFVLQHRDLDLKARQAEVDKMVQQADLSQLEADRRRALLGVPDLTDPSPKSNPEIDVNVTNK